MEQPTLSSQIDYLEQQRQADQAKIAELQQRLESQEYELQEQTQRIQKLEEDLAGARPTLGHVAQLDEQINRLKSELLQVMEERYGRHQPRLLVFQKYVEKALDARPASAFRYQHASVHSDPVVSKIHPVHLQIHPQ